MSKRKKVDPLSDELSSYEEAAELWGEHDTTDNPDAFAAEGDGVEPEQHTHSSRGVVRCLVGGPTLHRQRKPTGNGPQVES
ncbi:MAG: hypothetical protein PVI57_20195 [Gemmatimonadota bacterium]|jgi:hypothetical protein